MKVVEASAPGRCGIVGNPSDIYGGVVLSCSVPARATCRLTLGVPTQLPEDPTLWHAATARFPLENVKVEWTSDIPRSSGLAGSTALLAATLAAILTAKGETPRLKKKVDFARFAELVRDIEKNEAGVQCGFQDAYMVVHGGIQRMEFMGKSPTEIGPFATLESLRQELPFLLVTTGVERLSGSVHGPVIERWLARDPDIRSAVKQVTRLGTRGSAAFLKGDMMELASCMNENQSLIRGWGGSGDAIDRLVQDCMEEGAMAAKLAGAGMGGTVIALSLNLTELEQRLRNRGYRNFMRPSSQPGLTIEVLE